MPMEPTFLGWLYRQHAPALRLYARQWGDRGDDLVQLAFVRLAQLALTPEQVLPWLYKVVRNGALTAQREASRRKREQRASTPGKKQWGHRTLSYKTIRLIWSGSALLTQANPETVASRYSSTPLPPSSVAT